MGDINRDTDKGLISKLPVEHTELYDENGQPKPQTSLDFKFGDGHGLGVFGTNPDDPSTKGWDKNLGISNFLKLDNSMIAGLSTRDSNTPAGKTLMSRMSRNFMNNRSQME